MDEREAVFGAISAPCRREMLRMLAQGEMPVSALAEPFGMSLSAVSQHLAVLKEAGLVSQRKQGKQRFYRLEPAPLRQVDEWLETYRTFWPDRLHRLGRLLEENP